MKRLLILFAVFLNLPLCFRAHAIPNYEKGRGTVEIDPTRFESVFALSDVHGMFEGLLPLLQSAGIVSKQNHWAAGKSLLMVVGDSVDKGPKTIEVLDFWMMLSSEAETAGGRVVHLLGNHEAEFLAYGEKSVKAATLLKEMKRLGIPPASLGDPNTPRGAFLRQMPVAAKVGGWLFVHAGQLPANLTWLEMATTYTQLLSSGKYSDPLLLDDRSPLESRHWWQKKRRRQDNLTWLRNNGFFGLVFGHSPVALGVAGSLAHSLDGKFIKLDTGMAPEAGAHPGGLLVFPHPQELKLPQLPTSYMIGSGSPEHREIVPEKTVTR